MFKKTLSMMLVVLLINLVGATSIYADTKAEKEAQFAAKVKEGIAKLGTGESALVKVKLRDNTKVKGYIKDAGNESFTVIDAKTGMETNIAYSNAKQIKGNNLSTGVKVAIALAVLAGVLAILLFFENYG